MNSKYAPDIILSIFLWLIAVHSFIAGVLLIVFSPEMLDFFGFDIIEKFFSTQGGVFHIVMCLAYIPAAVKPHQSEQLIYFSIGAKFTATLFLLSYFFFKNAIWIVLFSGIADLLMAIILIILYRNMKLAHYAS